MNKILYAVQMENDNGIGLPTKYCFSLEDARQAANALAADPRVARCEILDTEGCVVVTVRRPAP